MCPQLLLLGPLFQQGDPRPASLPLLSLGFAMRINPNVPTFNGQSEQNDQRALGRLASFFSPQTLWIQTGLASNQTLRDPRQYHHFLTSVPASRGVRHHSLRLLQNLHLMQPLIYKLSTSGMMDRTVLVVHGVRFKSGLCEVTWELV